MLHLFRASMILLMAVTGAPLAAGSAAAAHQPDPETAPPEDMIDFLGRRKACSAEDPGSGEVLPAPPPGSWREWLACEKLASEELALRRRHQGDARAIAFLDQTPGAFRLEGVVLNTYDGPPAGRVEHAEQRGLDAGGRIKWRMVLNGHAAGGRATAITVSWGNRPSRTVYLDNRLLPWLDLGSAWVAVGKRPYETLGIELRYGRVRGWCADADRDDRSRVSLLFKPRSVQVSRQDRTNCNGNYSDLNPADFLAPPKARRH